MSVGVGTEPVAEPDAALLDSLAWTFDHAASIVAGVTDDQLTDPTPCRGWDVATLLGHMTGVVVNMGRGASGEELPAVAYYRLGADRARQFRTEADRTLAAWSTPGLHGSVDVGGGPMPVRTAIGINLVDTATHSWDLARATGQVEELPEEIAVPILGIGRGFVSDELRTVVGFDAAVPVGDDASPTTMLVAFLGRQP